MNAQDLITEYFKLKDWADAESKRFDEHVKPVKTRLEEITTLLLGILNTQGADKVATDAGTAYKSTIVTPSITDRDAYLDFVEENWAEIGNEILQLGAPNKKALQDYMDSHNGMLPPGIKTSAFTRVNIRRS